MHTCPMVTPGTPPIPHVGGPIIKGQPNVLTMNMPQARISDQCICVGPPDIIAKGSMTVLTGGLPSARMGDNTAHGGVIVSGAPTVLIGNGSNGGGSGGGGGAGMPGNVPFSAPNLQSKTMIAAHKEAKPFCEICESGGGSKAAAVGKSAGGGAGAGGQGTSGAGSGQSPPKSREEIIDEAISNDPKVAALIKKDPNAVYEYSPKPNAKGLGGLTKVNYNDEAQVANARKHRSAYRKENAKMEQDIASRRKKILDEGGDYDSPQMKALAEEAVEKRNELRHEANKQSGTIEAVEAANRAKFGDKNERGPTFDYLHDKMGKSVEQILDSSAKPNKAADIVVGLWP